MNQRDLLFSAIVDAGAAFAHRHPADLTDALLARGVRVVDEGERVISEATAEALRDVVRAYLANDDKGLLGACADLSAGMEADR